MSAFGDEAGHQRAPIRCLLLTQSGTCNVWIPSVSLGCTRSCAPDLLRHSFRTAQPGSAPAIYRLYSRMKDHTFTDVTLFGIGLGIEPRHHSVSESALFTASAASACVRRQAASALRPLAVSSQKNETLVNANSTSTSSATTSVRLMPARFMRPTITDNKCRRRSFRPRRLSSNSESVAAVACRRHNALR